jgi:hypothetical protein
MNPVGVRIGLGVRLLHADAAQWRVAYRKDQMPADKNEHRE